MEKQEPKGGGQFLLGFAEAEVERGAVCHQVWAQSNGSEHPMRWANANASCGGPGRIVSCWVRVSAVVALSGSATTADIGKGPRHGWVKKISADGLGEYGLAVFPTMNVFLLPLGRILSRSNMGVEKNQTLVGETA